MDVDLLAVYPHAHNLGKLFEAWATLPDGKRQWLIRIPAWNQNWQAVYRYRRPLQLPKGSVISMRWHYDNTTIHRVRSGNNAADEMGHLWLQLLPRDPRDRRRELEEAVMQHKVEKYPADWSSWLDLGELKLSRLESQGALSCFETAVRLDPKQSQAHNLLAAALNQVGRAPEALTHFETAVELDPANVNARYNLVFALIKEGQFALAETHLRQVIVAVPKDPAPHNLRGELLLRDGRTAEAIREFETALELDPTFTAAKENRDIAISRERHATN
jgi:tetratricopeptide (TPR) repeat protein